MAKKRTRSRASQKKNSASGGKASCFVISPFGGWFDKYYEDVFAPAIIDAGLHPCRADDLYRPSSIIHDIWQFVREAKILLADVTNKNPNVLYELGLAHAIGKPVIMVTQSLDDIPFDLRSLRIITYDLKDPAWGKDLKDQIESAVTEVLASPTLAVPPVFLKERKETAVPAVSPLEKMVLSLRQEVDSLRRSRLSVEPERTVLEPIEARDRIVRYHNDRMPDGAIVARLTRHGVPSRWTRDVLASLRAKNETEAPKEPSHPRKPNEGAEGVSN